MFESKLKKEYLTNFELAGERKETIMGIVTLLVLMTLFWVYMTSPAISFEEPYSIEIQKGSSLSTISNQLKDEGLIRSRTIFNAIVILRLKESKIISGEYLFHTPPRIFEIVKRMSTGDYGISVKQIRITEGTTVKEMGILFEEEFIRFNKQAFYELATDKEGYLFPDTYFFSENAKTHEILEVLEDTFRDKITLLKIEVDTDKSLEDIVIMASIIEKEATEDSRVDVSSILWKRIDMGMALQVDAPFVYSDGKGTFDLTKEDLQNDNNPYNTYVYTGLPPTPISNPGYESLKAAATPVETPYLFFLTGANGEMHYAKTFEEHKRNREKYLN